MNSHSVLDEADLGEVSELLEQVELLAFSNRELQLPISNRAAGAINTLGLNVILWSMVCVGDPGDSIEV